MPATKEKIYLKRRRRKYMALLFTAVIILIFVAFIRELYVSNRQFDWWMSAGRQHEAMIRKTISGNDTMVTVAAGPHYERGPVYCLFFGWHYRDIWTMPVQVRVFDINEVSGGLTVLKKGGNQQTLSLRLKSTGGKNFVLRTIDKDQAKALPENLRNPALKFLFRDQASALNPYAAVIIPDLAEAAGIFHTNPRIFYIPYDNRLGEFLPEFAGNLVIFEEFPDKTWTGLPDFGYAERIESTEDVLQHMVDSPDVRIDYNEFLRCRLFDLLIGDWDRHGRQWKWAGTKVGDTMVFRPIPRDRDVAFYKYNDGLMNSISLIASPKMQTFGENFRSIKGLVFNARHLDSALLGNVKEKEFLKIAGELKAGITDEVIDRAVRNFPPGVYEKIGKDIAECLRSRRDQLPEAAGKYYSQLHESD
jgi:signal peptidase I